ncbi:Tyrosine-protein kinase transforming protein Fps [Toxocara canis]|uniref:Tyrosine-protein kinase n=1 Tax=Toxocara canis TaxID=6265 RepID=A0A0B2VEQ6_TOXCA|nr:Tyrosine-protein kinase transforming protein Fps [Toxocara canis]
MALDEQTLKDIEGEEFYHGFLPREDISEMLKEVGDFILRLTQPKPGDPRELVISVRASMEPSSISIRHVILTRKAKQGGFDWIALEDEKYSSLKELIKDYVGSRRPINPEYKTSVLIRAVKRQSWEFLHDDVTLKDLLGEGQFGEVRSGVLNNRGKKIEVAIKIAKRAEDEKQMEKAKEKIKEMMHEARLMRNFRHVNVVRMYGVAVCREPLMIILEKIRHVILTRKAKQGGFDWIALEDEKYSSLKELIKDYVGSRRPINPEYKTSVLIRAVKRQSWEFLHDDVTLKDLLGEGQFGEVRSGVLNNRGKKIEVAIKIAKRAEDEKQMEKAKEKIKEMMHEARLMRNFRHVNVVRMYGVAVCREPLMIILEKAKRAEDEKQMEKAKEKIKEMMHEARLMRNFRHVNVVRMYGVAVCREPLMIILEKVNGGSLFDLLDRKKGQISEEEKIENMSLGAAKGLEYLHSQKCIHRDIASRNVLYTDSKVAKISDFGMSRMGTKYEMKRGTHKRIPLKWTAPESMVAFQYTPKTDVFSYSILLWEIFSDAAEPYVGLTCIEVKKMISCGKRLKKPQGCPDDMFRLMNKCWEQNPEKRYSMSEVVRFIEGLLEGCDETQRRTSRESQPRSKDEFDNEEEESTFTRLSKRATARKRRRKSEHKGNRRRRSHASRGQVNERPMVELLRSNKVTVKRL